MVSAKKLINTMENFNAILVLMERIYFLVRVAQERGLTNSNNGGKCRARYFCIATLVKKCKSICIHQRFMKITYILKPRQIGSKLYTLICEQGTECVIKRGSFIPFIQNSEIWPKEQKLDIWCPEYPNTDFKKIIVLIFSLSAATKRIKVMFMYISISV